MIAMSPMAHENMNRGYTPRNDAERKAELDNLARERNTNLQKGLDNSFNNLQQKATSGGSGATSPYASASTSAGSNYSSSGSSTDTGAVGLVLVLGIVAGICFLFWSGITNAYISMLSLPFHEIQSVWVIEYYKYFLFDIFKYIVKIGRIDSWEGMGYSAGFSVAVLAFSAVFFYLGKKIGVIVGLLLYGPLICLGMWYGVIRHIPGADSLFEKQNLERIAQYQDTYGSAEFVPMGHLKSILLCQDSKKNELPEKYVNQISDSGEFSIVKRNNLKTASLNDRIWDLDGKLKIWGAPIKSIQFSTHQGRGRKLELWLEGPYIQLPHIARSTAYEYLKLKVPGYTYERTNGGLFHLTCTY